MKDGLGMRYAFLGPLETCHLNAEGKCVCWVLLSSFSSEKQRNGWLLLNSQRVGKFSFSTYVQMHVSVPSALPWTISAILHIRLEWYCNANNEKQVDGGTRLILWSSRTSSCWNDTSMSVQDPGRQLISLPSGDLPNGVHSFHLQPQRIIVALLCHFL